MTSVAVDWVNLSTPEFVGWTRVTGVALPYPLNTGAQSYIATPSPDEVHRFIGERNLGSSAVLQSARSVFTDPRLVVYAVRAVPGVDETKYCALSGRQDGDAVLILLDSEKVALRKITDTELAAGVVGALPPMQSLRTPSAEVSQPRLAEAEAAIASGVSPRAMHAQLSHLGLPEELIALHEQTGAGERTSGVLAAVAFDDRGEGRHATRSAAWREFESGALLHVERPARGGEAMVLLTPCTQDALFRAAIDAVSSAVQPIGGF